METLINRLEWPLKVVTSGVAALWGGLQFLSQTLIVLMVADVITGVLASLASGRKLSSDISARGLAKKVMMLISVCISAWLEPVAGGLQLQNAVAGFWCANELLSCLENYGVAKMPIPPELRNLLAKLSPPEQADPPVAAQPPSA